MAWSRHWGVVHAWTPEGAEFPRKDPRFSKLAERIGLVDYWKPSRSDCCLRRNTCRPSCSSKVGDFVDAIANPAQAPGRRSRLASVDPHVQSRWTCRCRTCSSDRTTSRSRSSTIRSHTTAWRGRATGASRKPGARRPPASARIPAFPQLVERLAWSTTGSSTATQTIATPAPATRPRLPFVNAAEFAPALLRWHESDGRKDLPWQRDRTPYRVWVSEIMLQQTQVGTVIGYYERFIARFPTVRARRRHARRGAAPVVRARLLRARPQPAARGPDLVQRHRGEFPATLAELMELPGIGRSTAGAILALSSGERHAILDGNVKRVLARYFAVDGFPGDDGSRTQAMGTRRGMHAGERVADYTQGIMDLGATVCTRTEPGLPVVPGERRLRRTAQSYGSSLYPRHGRARPRHSATRGWCWRAAAARCCSSGGRPRASGAACGACRNSRRAQHAAQWCREHLSGSSASQPRGTAPARVQPLRLRHQAARGALRRQGASTARR